jgi:signal transduction histidine kinase
VVSDPTILRRILGNLVKNALEAVRVGEEVVISVTGDAEQITFHVVNPGVIPDHIQRQLFTRSVSSKAALGRGIGTYSAKLFTERYLAGSIGFVSSGEQGTRFWITIPSYPHA